MKQDNSKILTSASMTEPVALKKFTDWLCHEIPADTIISNPKWWAPRIWNAALRAQAAAHQAPAPASLRDMTESDFDKAHGIAPACVPDVAGLIEELEAAGGDYQNLVLQAKCLHTLAALQSQVDAYKELARQQDYDGAMERITELTAKLAEAVGLLCNAREELIEAIARLKGVGEVALAANDCSKDISAFLEKAREVMG